RVDPLKRRSAAATRKNPAGMTISPAFFMSHPYPALKYRNQACRCRFHKRGLLKTSDGRERQGALAAF
ncbi:MAG: hypothetical protein KGL64_00020, partial [Acidobacteriota bacterium]|nr:hypothetical protein [Acidobacteriota bacterium]